MPSFSVSCSPDGKLCVSVDSLVSLLVPVQTDANYSYKQNTYCGSREKGCSEGERLSSRFKDISQIVAATDSICLVDSGNKRICEASNSEVSAWNADDIDVGRLCGLAVSPDGYMYVSDSSSNQIYQISPSGSSIVWMSGYHKQHRFHGLGWMAIDPIRGYLYFTDRTNLGRVRLSHNTKLSPSVESSLIPDMEKLLDNPRYSDVKFLVEGRQIGANKGVLAVRSVYFDRMFSTDMSESQRNEVVIKDAKYGPFKAMLKFVFTDRLYIEESSDLSEVYGLAHCYQ